LVSRSICHLFAACSPPRRLFWIAIARWMACNRWSGGNRPGPPDRTGRGRVVTRVWNFLLAQYRERIESTGRQELFLLLIGTVVSFLCIRLSVRMIRAQVRWWPGNLKPGGLHIHHMVFGLGLLIATGAASFTLGGHSHPWRGILAFFFGVGVGLVLDEFALILHLEDVYWTRQGRKSVDAVILAISLFALALVGEAPLGGISDADPGWAIALNAVLGSLVVVVSLLKGKLWTGLLGIMVPLIAVFGAVRLARPGSPWARWRYAARPKRRARAQRREDRLHSRLARARVRIFDAVAGAPTKYPAEYPAEHLSEQPAEHLGEESLRVRSAPSSTGPAGQKMAEDDGTDKTRIHPKENQP
jgi:hypothetical protein